MMKQARAKTGRELPPSKRELEHILTVLLRVAAQLGVDVSLETPCVSCLKRAQREAPQEPTTQSELPFHVKQDAQP